MLKGFMTTWLWGMLLVAVVVMAGKLFEEQRPRGVELRPTQLLIIDVLVEGAGHPPHRGLDAVVLHVESILNSRALARHRTARGPPRSPARTYAHETTMTDGGEEKTC
jgi:hypothetical protein